MATYLDRLNDFNIYFIVPGVNVFALERSKTFLQEELLSTKIYVLHLK